MRLTIGIVFLVFGITNATLGQTNNCWTALLVKKGKQLEIRDNMARVNDHGFYLYRNCIYDIGLFSGKRYNARLIDIRKDTLVFLNYFNEQVAKRNGQTLDTLSLNYKSIDKIFLIADRSMGFFNKISLGNYDISFRQDTSNCELPIDKHNIYQGDSIKYDLVPFLTEQGLNWLYEINGRTYYYMGVMPKPEPREIDTVYRKKIIWFIPPFDTKVDEINGLGLGFTAWPSNFKDSLKVNGLCIEVLSLGFFAPIFGSFLRRDSIIFAEQSEPTTVKIKGVNINAGGAIGETEITGFYIGGVTTMVNKLKGFSVTGVHTIAHEMRGVSISGLRNQSKKARGVQIALFNSCKDLRGVQLGLWNRNQRRSLPIVNWSFKKT